MIYHEMFGQHLRLGNFLFQIAATIKLCKTHGCDTVYPEYYLWKFLKNPPTISEHGSQPHQQLSDIEFIASRKWQWTPEEEEWLNSFDFKNKDYQLALNFFFQSYKWFEGCEKEVYSALQPTTDTLLQYLDKYPEITRGHKRRLGIGVRLGDFIGHGDFYQIPFEWYTQALEEQFPNWREDYKVVVFSDDIEKAKDIFKDYPFLYPEPNNTHTHAERFKHYHSDKAADQFFLGYWMNDWIIGNSTFSWWQAWMATYKEGKTVHSGKFFSKRAGDKFYDNYTNLIPSIMDVPHYYPSHWIHQPIKNGASNT